MCQLPDSWEQGACIFSEEEFSFRTRAVGVSEEMRQKANTDLAPTIRCTALDEHLLFHCTEVSLLRVWLWKQKTWSGGVSHAAGERHLAMLRAWGLRARAVDWGLQSRSIAFRNKATHPRLHSARPKGQSNQTVSQGQLANRGRPMTLNRECNFG